MKALLRGILISLIAAFLLSSSGWAGEIMTVEGILFGSHLQGRSGLATSVTLEADGGRLFQLKGLNTDPLPEHLRVLLNRRVRVTGEVFVSERFGDSSFGPDARVELISEPTFLRGDVRVAVSGLIFKHHVYTLATDGDFFQLKPGKFKHLASLVQHDCVVEGRLSGYYSDAFVVDRADCGK